MININNQATKLNSEPPPRVRADLRRGETAKPIYLVLMSGGLPGRMIRLGPGETLLGRAEDNTLPIFDIDVSRYHAAITVLESGEVWIKDLGSTNGTIRNGDWLPSQVAVRVNDGDHLQFGSTVLFKFLRPTSSDERLLEILFERAACDPLTGLYNRAYFLDQVVYQAMSAGRIGHGLAILLLDIDHFKRINDTYGHGVGDEVLRTVAKVLRDSIRADDLIARYGGEEFIIGLTTPGVAEARAIAEQVRVNLAARPILVGGRALQVTASLGGDFAEAGSFRDASAMIQNADLALYRAKHAGRDRVDFEDRSIDVPTVDSAEISSADTWNATG